MCGLLRDIHQLHIGQDIAGILPDGYLIALVPEFPGCIPDSLDEAELLHVARGKSPVKVINERYDRIFLHDFTTNELNSPQISEFFATKLLSRFDIRRAGGKFVKKRETMKNGHKS